MIVGMHAHCLPISHRLQWSSRAKHVAVIIAAQAEAYALGCSGRDTGVDEQHLLALAPSNKRPKTADAHRHAARPWIHTACFHVLALRADVPKLNETILKALGSLTQ